MMLSAAMTSSRDVTEATRVLAEGNAPVALLRVWRW